MTLAEFFLANPDLSSAKHTERIRALGWYFQSSESRPRFAISDVRAAYEKLGMAKPANFSQLFAELVGREELLKIGDGFILERRLLDACEAKYGRRPITIQIDRLLADLPSKVPSVTEREFLEETLRCYRVEAFRASIVMAWNLTYHHVCSYMLSRHREAFNRQIPVRFPNKKLGVTEMKTMDDLAELKESEVIAVCRSAGIITADVSRLLEEKLGKRNSAAHPSTIRFSQAQVDAYIEDLVTNVVLKLA